MNARYRIAASLFACIGATACTQETNAPQTAQQEPSVATAATPVVEVTQATVAQIESAIESMARAVPSAKMGAPVDVYFQLSGVAAKDRATSLQLVVVPRIAGTNLRVELPASVSIDVDERNFAFQKAEASGVYRKNLLVTPRQTDTGTLQVIVFLNVGSDSYAGNFTIPIGSDVAADAKSTGKTGLKRPQE